MSDRRTLYIPEDLWERLVRRVAREQAETGEQVSVSAFVRRLIERELPTPEEPSKRSADP